MRKGTMVLALAVLAASAAMTMWGQAAQVTIVPIKAQYFEPAFGGLLSFGGSVYLYWGPVDAVSGSRIVTKVFVASAYPVLSGGPVYAYRGFSEDTVSAVPGSMVELTQPFLANDPERARTFSGSLKVTAAVPDKTEASANGQTAIYARVPLSGNYYEPAIGDLVSYGGAMHLFWIPPSAGSGTQGWTVVSYLAANARSLSGMMLSYHGVCQDSVDFSAAAAGKYTQAFWVDGLVDKGTSFFEGKISVALDLPKDAPQPTVTVVAFAGK